MSVAQKLYESGHITYMRTDSMNLSKDSIISMKQYIKSTFGEKYFKERVYVTKAKVAQEAHEAIRPTNISDLDYCIMRNLSNSRASSVKQDL